MNTTTEALMRGFHVAFVICMLLTIVFLAIAIALFFLLKIRNVIRELSGRAQRDAMAEMGKEGASRGGGPRIGIGLSGKVGSGRTTSGPLGRKGHRREGSGMTLTDRIQKPAPAPATAPMIDETAPLVQEPVPTPPDKQAASRSPKQSNGFTVTRDIIVIHTQETI